MIFLNDLLNFTEEQISNAKIRFHDDNGENDPIEVFKKEPDLINKKWLYWRTENRYFNVGQIAICLVRIQNDYWLLTTIDTVDSELNVKNGVNYTSTPFEEYKKYYGRVIIKYHKKHQSQGIYYSRIKNELEVLQILPSLFDDDDFPGYDKVKLTFMELKSILERGKSDWIAALENQKAVYLITDKCTGKLYVGSATSDSKMLLQRWKSYIADGHGGNKELKRVVNEKGFQYICDYFQYSILENYNSKVDDKIILERESWWKEVLQSRKFGYNDN